MKKVSPNIFIVIPCFNNLDVLKKSIPAIYSDKLSIVVFDDGSSDGTGEWLKNNYPKITRIEGDGSNWWTGSLKKAIDYCLALNCDYIVSLNADVVISPNVVSKLLICSKDNNNAIVASLVVDIKKPTTILWSGSKFDKIHRLIPIFSSKYFFKAGQSSSEVGINPYTVDEVHGRGVLIPTSVINLLGNYDSYTFPHYGGDTDFSFRAKAAGVKMIVNPACKAKVYTENTSLNKKLKGPLSAKFVSIRNYLFDRKSGEAAYVWWNLYRKHLPLRYFFQSYLFVIALNIYRRLSN